MSSRILTTSIAGIDAFMRDPRGVLTHAEGGTLAVFADNAPAFYAVTPERLAQLLEIEAKLSRPASDVMLDNQFFDEPASAPVRSNGEISHVRRLAAGRRFSAAGGLMGNSPRAARDARRAGGLYRLLAG